MPTKQITVTYSVKYTTTITINPSENGDLPTINDMISNIDIPENETSTYVPCSMETISVLDHDDMDIPESEWDKN
jgi:hypothetical protein